MKCTSVATVVAALTLICLISRPAFSASWVATWAASPQPTQTLKPPPPTLANQTIRQTLHLSRGGTSIRLHISQLFAHQTLEIQNVHVAIQDHDAVIVPASDRAVTFSGQSQLTLAPGAEVISDPISLNASADQNLSVSFYFAAPTTLETFHARARENTYLAAALGDHTQDIAPTASILSTSWYLLTGVDVLSDDGTQAIVAIGDSITDGVSSSLGLNRRWPDFLAQRLRTCANANTAPRSVVNEGIAFNFVLRDVGSAAEPSVSLQKRFSRDALQVPGVGYVVLFEGINDIGNMPSSTAPQVLVDSLIKSYRSFVAEAHAHGLRIFIATLTPISGAINDSPVHEGVRTKVNDWIRASTEFDGIFDFDRALRDPAKPQQLLSIYDSGDHLHPNDAGNQAMARAVDLSSFGANRCRN